MTVVNVTAALTALGGSEPVTSGRITVEYLRGKDGEPATRAVGAAVTLPAPIVVAIIDGSPVEPVDVPPTDGTCYARVWVECRAPRDAGFLELPAVAIPATGPVDITALQAVDPATFEPVTTVVTAWQLVVDEVADMRDVVVAKTALAVAAAVDAGDFAGAADFDADRAGQSAFQAGQSAASALGHKNAASGSAVAAAGSATSAAASVVAASTERQGAADERLGARQERQDAQTARTGAETAQTGAQTARTGAESARTGSESAKTAAELARDVALTGQFVGTLVATAIDLNTLTTPGIYRVNVGIGSGLNAPFAGWIGTLQVVPRDGGPTGASIGRITQIAFTQNGGATPRVFHMRTNNSSGWDVWRSYTTQRINNPGGQPGVEVYTWDDANGREQALMPVATTLGSVDLNAVTLPGVYRQPATSSATLGRNYPAADVVGVLIVAMIDPAGPTLIQQFQLGNQSGVARGFYQRRLFGSTWTPWFYIPSQRVDQTAGRTVYTWDDVNGREQLVYGDTGWRNIESLLLNGWSAVSGQLRIRRVGATVFLRFAGASPAAATSDAFMLNLAGFNASFNQGWFAGSSSRLLRQQAGEFQMINKGTGQIYDNFTWPTDDVWPTSLPGTSASNPVVN